MMTASGRVATGRRLGIRAITMGDVQLGRAELAAVRRVLLSGRLRSGPVVEDFESRFARAVGARFAVAVNSGTAALYLAYVALLHPGDEIIVPDFTFVATASMALAAGLKVVLADVDPHSFTLDPAAVERRITPRTRAIVPVHLFGQPAEVRGFARLARRHRLRLIWDAAQAHGACYRGRDVGSFPDVACYSFYASKNITTGEGGMITTSDAQLASELRLLRSHGEEGRYRHVRLGFNVRLTEMAAALGRVQLARLPAVLRRRRTNAQALTRALAGISGILAPQRVPGTDHAYCLFTIVLDPDALGMSRERFQAELARRGIATAVHYPSPLHRQPIFRRLGTDAALPVSARLARTVLSLPVHPGLSRHDLVRVAQAVREIAGR